MIYELRTYDMVPELFEEYLDRADRLLLPIIIEKIGFRVIGFWRAVSESPGSLRAGEEEQMPKIPAQVVWMIAWESLEERAQKWAELHNDVEWQGVFDGKYYVKTHFKFITPTQASPLK
jgi:hypothetical protein